MYNHFMIKEIKTWLDVNKNKNKETFGKVYRKYIKLSIIKYILFIAVVSLSAIIFYFFLNNIININQDSINNNLVSETIIVMSIIVSIILMLFYFLVHVRMEKKIRQYKIFLDSIIKDYSSYKNKENRNERLNYLSSIKNDKSLKS